MHKYCKKCLIFGRVRKVCAVYQKREDAKRLPEHGNTSASVWTKHSDNAQYCSIMHMLLLDQQLSISRNYVPTGKFNRSQFPSTVHIQCQSMKYYSCYLALDSILDHLRKVFSQKKIITWKKQPNKSCLRGKVKCQDVLELTEHDYELFS